MRLIVCLVAGVWTAAALADWPMWRGPLRNGVQPDGTKLTENLPAADWKPVWESEAIPADTEGGFGSPVVADGRVYLYCSWRVWVDIPERLLTADAARQLGLLPEGLPADLLAEIEAARTSPERTALKGGAIGKWSREWVVARPAVTQQVAIARFAEDRLNRGDRAFAADELRRVPALIGKKLATPDDLVNWFKTNAITGPLQERMLALIPAKVAHMDDVTLCLDAADGRTLWKKTHPGRVSEWGASATPAVASGIVCVAGSSGVAYAYDAKTGDLRWTNAVMRQAGINGSPVFHGNRFYLQAGGLVALDAATGTAVWRQDKIAGSDMSPVIWEHDAKTYVISGGQKLSCADAADGQVLWSAVGSQYATPAVSGNFMAVQNGTGLVTYCLSPTGAQKIADIPGIGSRGGSAAMDGKHAYVAINPKAACVEAATGTVVWTVAGAREDFASPLLADGKLIAFGGGGRLIMYDTATGKTLTSAKVDAVRCTSPALADGRLYVRTAKSVRCYDLRVPAAP
jgi:outer membrane protein assembly factor BamB